MTEKKMVVSDQISVFMYYYNIMIFFMAFKSGATATYISQFKTYNQFYQTHHNSLSTIGDYPEVSAHKPKKDFLNIFNTNLNRHKNWKSKIPVIYCLFFRGVIYCLCLVL